MHWLCPQEWSLIHISGGTQTVSGPHISSILLAMPHGGFYLWLERFKGLLNTPRMAMRAWRQGLNAPTFARFGSPSSDR